ncbi:hypothetical protein GC173_00505 [bacterium]|nr:hypothetical protein [bacterium]
MKAPLHCVTFLLLATSLGCHYTPRWTPATVQPPASLETALLNADEARAKTSPLDDDSTQTLRVSRDGAILTALSRNRSLAVERLNPDIARTSIAEQRAAFDPSLLGTTTTGRSRTLPAGSATDGDDAAETSTASGQLELTQDFATGTAATLTGGLARSQTDGSDARYSSDWSLKVSQSLLRGAGTAVNLVDLRQANNNAAISMHALRDTVLNLVQSTDDAYWDVALAHETRRIRETALEAALEQERTIQARFENGSATAADLSSARAEVASRRTDLIDAEAGLRNRTLELIRLLSPETPGQWNAQIEPIDAPDIVEITNDPTISDQLAIAYRPDLAQSRLQLANADLEVVRTRNGLLPQLDGFASYGRNGYGESVSRSFDDLDSSRYDEYGLGLEFQYSPLNRAARARDRRARFQRIQAEESIANLEELIAYQVRRDIVAIEQQYARIAATKVLLESRREQLRTVQARYENGSATLLDVLDIRSDAVSAEVDLMSARVEYIKALTALHRDEGTLLDRRGVGIDQPKEKKS